MWGHGIDAREIEVSRLHRQSRFLSRQGSLRLSLRGAGLRTRAVQRFLLAGEKGLYRLTWVYRYEAYELRHVLRLTRVAFRYLRRYKLRI